MACARRSAPAPVRSELAPSGALRVAIAIAPAVSTFYSARDSATGRPIGVAVDLGAALAHRLGVPVQYVAYANSGEISSAADRGEWDVTFMPVDQERARQVDFGPAYNLFESTYLVGGATAIQRIADVDRPDVRVGIVENTTTGRSAARQLERALVVSFGSVEQLSAAFAGGKVEAIALSRSSLRPVAARVPGSRILDGSFHSTANAVAVPRQRPAALAYVSAFIEEAKRSGEVRRAFDRAGLTDAVVAPPAPSGR